MWKYFLFCKIIFTPIYAYLIVGTWQMSLRVITLWYLPYSSNMNVLVWIHMDIVIVLLTICSGGCGNHHLSKKNCGNVIFQKWLFCWMAWFMTTNLVCYVHCSLNYKLCSQPFLKSYLNLFLFLLLFGVILLWILCLEFSNLYTYRWPKSTVDIWEKKNRESIV